MSYPSVQLRLGNMVGVSIVGIAGVVLAVATLAYLALIIREAYRVTVSATEVIVPSTFLAQSSYLVVYGYDSSSSRV